MRGEIVALGDGARIIISRIDPVGEKNICFEIHRPEAEKFDVSFVLLTEKEAIRMATAVLTISEAFPELSTEPPKPTRKEGRAK